MSLSGAGRNVPEASHSTSSPASASPNLKHALPTLSFQMRRHDMTAKRGNGVGAAPKRSTLSGRSETGYGRPPEHGRFKPGQSGNPKAPPEKSRNATTSIRRVLDSAITVRDGYHTHTCSNLQALIFPPR